MNAPVQTSSQADGTNAATAPEGVLTKKKGKARTQSSEWGAKTRNEILAYIVRNKDDLTIEEASVKFGLSMKTAAHYLSTLAGQGVLERVSIYRVKSGA